MGRPSNTRERRAQIALALMGVMAHKGYEGASVHDVAAAAGLTPGLLHYHFGSKQEILLELVDQLTARHLARIDAYVARARSPRGRVEAFIDCHLERGAGEDPAALACWIALGGEALRSPEVRARYAHACEAFTERLRGLLQAGVAAGVFRCDDPRAVSAAVFAVIEGYYVLSATARELIPRGSAAPTVRRMLSGVLPPARRAAGAARRKQ